MSRGMKELPMRRRKLAGLLAMAAAALASGCSVGPDYARPAAPTPAVYKEEKGWKPSQPQTPMSENSWWSIYNDPLLDDLEKQVDVSNQNLKAAEAAYRESRAVVDVARAAFFPPSPPTDRPRGAAPARVPAAAMAAATASAPARPRPTCSRSPLARHGSPISGARCAVPSRAT
jgi:hypothetical protein